LHFICQDVKVQVKITREFARRLVAQHGSYTDVPDEYKGWTLPLHVLSVQAYDGKRQWSDVVLLLNHLPPRMAKDVLMRTDGYGKEVPLHAAAANAPRSVIDCMLALAPDAARVKDARGDLPLHHAAYNNNNVDAIESLMNAYPNALLETNNGGDTPIDVAINNGRGDEFLKKMLLEALKRACSNKFLNYGTLLDDKSLYNASINPVNMILLECVHDKRSADDVVEFFDQLQREPTIFRALVYHAMKSNTESSPGIYARRIKCDEYVRARLLNSLKNAGDDREGIASRNASAGLGDSPKGPDRLGRRPLAKAVAKVLKTIEDPYTSITCSLYGGWGSGKTQLANILLDEIKPTLEEKEYLPLEPTLSFIWVCNLVWECCYCFNHKHETSRTDIKRTDTVNVSEKILRFCLYCCCGFFMLPIYISVSYISNWFKSGKILISHMHLYII